MSHLWTSICHVKKSDLRIVFLGTPDFAVESLRVLLNEGYQIVGVITAPDRLGGRGRNQVIQSDVKKFALEKGLKILQPKNLKNADFQNELKSLEANLQIVVAFRMLPRAVWDMPEFGTYNLHGSLLPAYRGAAPINWAIINGEEFTGVTTFKLKHEIDTGSIAYQERIAIERDENFEAVYNKLKVVGAQLVLKTVKAIDSGSISLNVQDESNVSKAPKIFHEDCFLDFSDSPFNIYNKVRGLSPYPVAWTTFLDKKLKLYSVQYSYHQHNLETGVYFTDKKKFLGVTCNNGLIFFDTIQAEGKRKMGVRDFLNGFDITKSNSPSLLQIQSPWTL